MKSPEGFIQDLPRFYQQADRLELREDTASERLLLKGLVHRSDYGIVGYCLAQKPEFVAEVCDSFADRRFLNGLPPHRAGEQTIELLCCALNALPGVSAEPIYFSPEADRCKWNLVIKWKDYFFPIQVKNSMRSVRKALEEDRWSMDVQQRVQELEEEIALLQTSYFQRIGSLKQDYQNRQQLLKELMTQYQMAMPLYVWVTPSAEAMSLLMDEFARVFGVDGGNEKYREQALSQYREKQLDLGKWINVVKDPQYQARRNLPVPL